MGKSFYCENPIIKTINIHISLHIASGYFNSVPYSVSMTFKKVSFVNMSSGETIAGCSGQIPNMFSFPVWATIFPISSVGLQIFMLILIKLNVSNSKFRFFTCRSESQIIVPFPCRIPRSHCPIYLKCVKDIHMSYLCNVNSVH